MLNLLILIPLTHLVKGNPSIPHPLGLINLNGFTLYWIMHLMHITLVVKLMDEIIHFNGANHPQILIRPFGGSIHVIHAPQKWSGSQTWC